METPGIIFTCLAISLLLLLLICGLCVCLFYPSKKITKQRYVEPPRRIEPFPTVSQTVEPKRIIIPSEITPVTPKQEFQRLSRPANLEIIEQPKIVQNAFAVETDHATEHFLREMSEPSENRTRLIEDEFEVLSKTEARRTTKSGEKAARHRSSNRYADIVPYDHTIVPLRKENYINANFIHGENDPLRWIATQAPIGIEEGKGVDTVPDFWLMVLQNNVECIVMLTDIFENFEQKCAEYFPKIVGEGIRYEEGVTVSLVSESEEGRIVHREFDVYSANRSSQVSHYQYKHWRDNDAPEISSFLDFLLLIRQRQFKSPIVVHCSAGIGRTGVFICSDNVISRIRNEGIIDIFIEVNRARQQRPSMVNTLAQYESIYDIIALYLRRYYR
ncbi:unnamed protein product [Caenorhabditis angaria]|uniref:Protein-tyrosine-phosphatase n=1 Tax=Caenorhabditis angaria TaxID=860376 RepID=A0A9P1I350_9PELO|nr:unnamed protein product [Caenorhabditis angaria]